jgi:SOS response regulatory protein OraA/RecX
MDESRYQELLRQTNRFLLYRQRSALEVKKRLKQKSICTETEASAFIDQLREQGLVDDKSFAEERISFRLHNGYGRRYIERELRQAGIASELLARLMPDDNEFIQAARRYLQRRSLPDPLARLRSRGFTESVLGKLRIPTRVAEE